MSDIMDVLRVHSIAGMSGGTHIACRCDRRWVLHDEYREHLAAVLSAAGFGPVKEARAEALEAAADAAFKDKKVQGLQRVLIGTWIRTRAASIRSAS